MDLSLFLFRLSEVQFFGGWVFGHCGSVLELRHALTRAAATALAGKRRTGSWVWLRGPNTLRAGVATISLVARDLYEGISFRTNK
jgi:hypothetical protein